MVKIPIPGLTKDEYPVGKTERNIPLVGLHPKIDVSLSGMVTGKPCDWFLAIPHERWQLREMCTRNSLPAIDEAQSGDYAIEL